MVREVSGLDGKYLAHSTRRDKNLKPVTARKIKRKMIQKKRVCFAKFLTIFRLSWLWK